MHYTLHQLKIFYEIGQCKSITKAAERLNLTQPAVSLQFKKFQDQFDIPLIELINKRLYLTDFGVEICEAARNILQETDSIEEKTHQYKGRLTGKFRLAAVSTAKYIVPYLITDFLKPNPAIELLMEVTNRAMVLKSLQENQIDFGMLSVLPENLDLQFEKVMENRLYLVGKGSDDNSPDRILAEDLDKIPMIYREEGSATRRMMEKLMNERKSNFGKRFELSSNEAVKQAILAGLGYSVMPLIGIRNELIRGELKIIKTEGLPIINHWYIVWNKGKQLNPASAAFLEFFRINRDRLVRAHFGWIEEYITGL